MDQQLFNHQVITSPWIFHFSLHRFFRVAQAQTQRRSEEKRWSCHWTSRTVARKSYVSGLPRRCHNRRCVFASARHISKYSKYISGLYQQIQFFCGSSLLLSQRLQASTLGNRRLLQHLHQPLYIIVIILFITPLRGHLFMEKKYCCLVKNSSTILNNTMIPWQKYILYCQSIKTS